MDAVHDDPPDVLRIRGKIDHVDVAARRHHRAHRAVAKSHHPGNHRALAGLDHSRALRFRDQGLDFFVGNAVLRLGLVAEQLEQNPPGGVQQPHQGRSDGGHTVMTGATRTAIRSGSRKPICLGTSSPTTSDR